ncbi:transposase [Sorangium sp. So ce854]|uniref:transposase n=1 Tax=Sorangium sp. So ce854 TaxID=3133322 RepID=UPI003F60FBC5
MANVLPAEKRLRVLAALVDGNSVRATERMTGVQQRTIRRFALALGQGAERLHNRLVRDLRCVLVQVDEIWGYVQKKQSRVTEKDPPDVGEAYTFVAMDTLSRLVIAYRVGKRDQATTDAFIADLRARMLVMPQLTSDGFAPYIPAVGESFGKSIDYMQTVKNYRSGSRGRRDDDHRYEPPRDPFITKTTIYGAPDPRKASTAYVERLNGTTRHQNGRMRRLCLAFSKRIEHHRASVALVYAYYNLCHVVKTLRVTPAMQAGLTDHVWGLDEFLEALLAEGETPAPEAQPLAHREPAAPARPLPGGRGFLRLVTEPTPALKRSPRHPEPPPSAPPVHAAPPPPPDPPRRPVQLDLFDLGEPPAPED